MKAEMKKCHLSGGRNCQWLMDLFLNFGFLAALKFGLRYVAGCLQSC
jgi:hypothetical protein